MSNQPQTLSILGLILSSFLLSACLGSTAPTSPPSAPLGTWIVMTMGGTDVSSLQLSYNFTETEVTLTGDEGCQTKSSYTISGSSLIMTVISDDCNGQSAGSRDTAAFSVNGDQLTLISGGDSTVLKKGTPSPVYLTGSWTVETLNGNPPPSGYTLKFERDEEGEPLFYIIRSDSYKPENDCTSTYAYEKRQPGVINFDVVTDFCDLTFTSTEATYTVTSTTLTLTILGQEFVATRQ